MCRVKGIVLVETVYSNMQEDNMISYRIRLLEKPCGLELLKIYISKRRFS